MSIFILHANFSDVLQVARHTNRGICLEYYIIGLLPGSQNFIIGAFLASEFFLNIFGVVVAYWLEFGLSFVGNGDTQIRWRVRSKCKIPFP